MALERLTDIVEKEGRYKSTDSRVNPTGPAFVRRSLYTLDV